MNRFNWAIGMLVSLTVLGNAAPSRADVAVPMGDVVPRLQEATQMPILLPSQVPMDEVFLDVEAESDRYYVGFDYRPDCRSATACHYGEIMAEQSGSMSVPENAEEVALTDGTPAYFFSTCGAHCTASLQWRYGGVMYRVMVKNGTKEGTIALANSAMLRGDRRSVSSSASSSTPSSTSSTTNVPRSGMASLISSEPGSAINIRAGVGTSSEILHLGYSGDRVEILNQVSGTDGYRWYNIRFPQSGAAGWVRGDFIAP
jgi:Bacterial SH3 domain